MLHITALELPHRGIPDKRRQSRPRAGGTPRAEVSPALG
jgi:hypothetical protein